MKRTFHDAEKLAQAYELQRRAVDLHVAPPPIVKWGAKIFDANGEQIEEILAKSNSYTRNALNVFACQSTWIARHSTAASGLIGGGFSDGAIGGKTSGGTTYANLSAYGIYQSAYGQSEKTGEDSFSFLAGYSDAEESIDSYILGNEFGTGTAENQLTKGVSAKSSLWDGTHRKFVTTFSRQFTNGYSSSQTIKEIGLYLYMQIGSSSAQQYLVLRDVLASPITLASGQTVILYYQLEALIA